MSREMMESGIDWIGRIPRNWEIHPVKHVLAERKEGNNPITVTDILSLTNTRGVIPYSEKGEIGNKAKEDISGYKIVRENDIVINSMNLYIGSVGLSKYVGVVSPVYYMLYKRNPLHSIDYFSLLFQTKELQSKSHGYGNGILDIRMRIPMSNLNTLPLPVPPNEEQHRIVYILNKKTAEIDQLIALQEQQIEKLKEYKQSVISKAVTKGLDPNAPMKDSGTKLLGFIPASWETKKLKYIAKINNGKEVEAEGGPIPVYGSGGVFKWTERSIYDLESILMGRKGTIDRPLYVKEPFWAVDTMFYLSDFKKCVIKYMYYCSVSQIDFNLHKSGSVLPSMTQTDLGQTTLTFPSINEQRIIVDYLEKTLQKHDSMISIHEKKIDRLYEYKKSLIYEYITGKKQVL